MTVPKEVRVLREMQEKDPTLGALFSALHTFLDRVRDEFFGDYPDLPHPVIALEKDRRKRMGYYTQKDGYAYLHRINLNPYGLRTGVDAAETLAHEFVHVWQLHVGRPCRNNYHGREFHEMMLEYGIISTGRGGYHEGYTDDKRWHDWMITNKDLELENFILPGMDDQKTRKMLKLQCLKCGNSFRNRRIINVICGDCGEQFKRVEGGP